MQDVFRACKLTLQPIGVVGRENASPTTGGRTHPNAVALRDETNRSGEGHHGPARSGPIFVGSHGVHDPRIS
jgi:hypothetical protein